MTEDLYLEQVKLEEEARGLTIQRFHRDHSKATLDETFSETFLGSHLLKNYLKPFSEAISEYLQNALSGRAGKNNRTAKYLNCVDVSTSAYLMTKAILNKVCTYQENKQITLTALAIYGAGLIHDEIRLREFDAEYPKLSKRIHEDFGKRELRRDKRLEYMQAAFRKVDMDWSVWTKADMLRIGVTLLSLFKQATGDIRVETVGVGRSKKSVVLASEALIDVVQKNADSCEALFTTHFPMVVPPLDWSEDTLSSGGYLTHNVTRYPLVKGSKRAYRAMLSEKVRSGGLSNVLTAVNALQRTGWQINARVLDVLEDIFENNIECGKLPRSDKLFPDPPPAHLEGLDRDHPDVKEYRAYCFRIHEANRRMVGKRVMASRAFMLARKFSVYDNIYFPYDLDSRGRAYPKPSGLHPQGPDYVKGLLRFGEARPLGFGGVFWLGVHGANCWGEDKLPIPERAQWAEENLDLARRVAADPTKNLEWTKADSPVQFLAWAIEWSEAFSLGNPEEYLSKLHVDLDATCSGLQHFSAMLRDEVGGYHVNMVPNDVRQDVYGAVAAEAKALIEAEKDEELKPMAAAWLSFGIDRKTTKRSVMVKPYAGTRSSCNTYVTEAVDEKLKAGVALPVPKDDLWKFKMYGAGKVWNAIPKVVVAADGAMKWLMDVTKLVAKSQPEDRRIEWVTPSGFPVHQYKFDVRSRRVDTFFDGSVIQPRLSEDTDMLDPRKMASSVAPSFVHSLDASHLQMTVAKAREEGIVDFAVVHDSFGVHASEIPRFCRIIREAFVGMYEDHDVLDEFMTSALPLIAEEHMEDVPPMPERGSLDLRGVLENPFFFS
ncbi:DNA-directed RNA polymerase [uncultured Cohaesibacter sp.]|uniref:DNA-directed RNA polymerase n=1 Tax=uncultured Cohaesibacter sp. TaxID=1002546 RepID=UPI0029C749C8|nr:DNA-directed RNA polymerase [uncultured Cohaesibacter sp.]